LSAIDQHLGYASSGHTARFKSAKRKPSIRIEQRQILAALRHALAPDLVNNRP
jgi:hypothetical protein